MSYYEAAKSWYEENKHKLSLLRRRVFKVWLKIMKAKEKHDRKA